MVPYQLNRLLLVINSIVDFHVDHLFDVKRISKASGFSSVLDFFFKKGHRYRKWLGDSSSRRQVQTGLNMSVWAVGAYPALDSFPTAYPQLLSSFTTGIILESMYLPERPERCASCICGVFNFTQLFLTSDIYGSYWHSIFTKKILSWMKPKSLQQNSPLRPFFLFFRASAFFLV